MLLGAKALTQDFKKLKKGVDTAALRKSVRAGGKVLQKQAARNAPRNRSGRAKITFKDGSKKRKLSQSIRVEGIKTRSGKTGVVGVNVGWLKSAFHGNFIHAGTPGHVIKTSGRSLKTHKGDFLGREVKVSGTSKNPFLAKAYQSQKGNILKATRKQMALAVQKAAAAKGANI